MSEPIELPIDGELDLHLFHPDDVKMLVPDYLDECKLHGISDVRIIHGKGTGVLREIVHTILKRRPDIISYHLTDHNWGSTSVVLNLKTQS